MTRFGFSEESADKAKTQLDRELAQVEYHLDRIARAVPQAGATVSDLEQAKTLTQNVVYDLHDEIDRRTEVSV